MTYHMFYKFWRIIIVFIASWANTWALLWLRFGLGNLFRVNVLLMPVIAVLSLKLLVTVPIFPSSFLRCLNRHFGCLNMFWIGTFFYVASPFHAMFKTQTTQHASTQCIISLSLLYRFYIFNLNHAILFGIIFLE